MSTDNPIAEMPMRCSQNGGFGEVFCGISDPTATIAVRGFHQPGSRSRLQIAVTVASTAPPSPAGCWICTPTQRASWRCGSSKKMTIVVGAGLHALIIS
jgi:hypothetical protein